ncbi:MAG: shikimate kinase [Roseobacter sp.]
MSEIQQSVTDRAPLVSARLKKTVVMVGMMGAGKTAVGRALAAALAVPFVDSDHEIEVAANMSVPEIFARDGEAFFRKRETEVIQRLLEGPACVLSTGGGAFMSDQNRRAITAFGVSVWLDADVALLWSRVKHRDTRPLLRTDDPRATLEKLCAERVPAYQMADLRVPCAPPVAIEIMAQRVIETLMTRPDVLEVHNG